MINKKEWKEYSDMIDLYNKMVQDSTDILNEEWNKKELSNIYKLEKEEDLIFIKHIKWPSLYPFKPILKLKTIENYLDWITKGKPLLVKILKVKNEKNNSDLVDSLMYSFTILEIKNK